MRAHLTNSLKIVAGAALAFASLAFDAAATPTFSVAIDQARPLTLRAPAAGIVVGNPGIAGVSLQSDTLLFITGRSYGSTNLIVVGANGKPIYESRISVVPDSNGTTVTVTKGTATVRNECNPICRASPDPSDDPGVFETISKQNAEHAGAAGGQ